MLRYILGLAPEPKSIQRHPLDPDPLPSDIDWIYGSARVDENVDPQVTLIPNICRYRGFICAERGKYMTHPESQLKRYVH